MKTVLVGAGGYGGVYLDLLFSMVGGSEAVQLTAVVDPFAEKAAHYQMLLEKSIPIYDTLEAFYAKDHADLVIISSPIQLHKAQAITALESGSNVLCEKPITALSADALEMDNVARRCGKKLGVGFQWSFCDAIQALKKDIEKGVYGKPLRFKTCISWPRENSYYAESPWKGKILDNAGNPVHDSIITNATAHYLHNMFFVVSAKAKSHRQLLYKAYDIETFDTCVMQGIMENGCEFFFGVTHVGEEKSEPMFIYEFENGVVIFDENKEDMLYGIPKNGDTIAYGSLQSSAAISQKITRMAEAITQDKEPLCTVSDVQPHQLLCNEIFTALDVKHFAPERVNQKENRRYVTGLWEGIQEAYREFTLPEKL